MGDIRTGAVELILWRAARFPTRTLTARVPNLIRNGVDPRRILLLTFTRRAQSLIADATASGSSTKPARSCSVPSTTA